MLILTPFTICDVPHVKHIVQTCVTFLVYSAEYAGLEYRIQMTWDFFTLISKSRLSFLPQECWGSRALKEKWATWERWGLLETEVGQWKNVILILSSGFICSLILFPAILSPSAYCLAIRSALNCAVKPYWFVSHYSFKCNVCRDQIIKCMRGKYLDLQFQKRAKDWWPFTWTL